MMSNLVSDGIGGAHHQPPASINNRVYNQAPIMAAPPVATMCVIYPLLIPKASAYRNQRLLFHIVSIGRHQSACAGHFRRAHRQY